LVAFFRTVKGIRQADPSLRHNLRRLLIHQCALAAEAQRTVRAMELLLLMQKPSPQMRGRAGRRLGAAQNDLAELRQEVLHTAPLAERLNRSAGCPLVDSFLLAGLAEVLSHNAMAWRMLREEVT
jgi:hypothetical protein